MALKLEYFDINGIAESIRYMLHYSKQIFEDVRYSYENWPDKNIKDSLPYGQLPIYHEGDRSLNQSFAIARYVGNKGQLVPTDLWEQAVLDEKALNINDFMSQMFIYTRENNAERKEALKNKLKNEICDYYFSRFEKELQANNGHFSGKLSWVDFVLIGIFDTSKMILAMDLDDKYPTIHALSQKIKTLPGVKEYISTRPQYNL